MNKSCIKMCMTAVSLLLAANLAFAAEVKVAAPDAGGGAKTTAAGAKSDAKGVAADAKASVKAKPVDINTASEAELKAIPGIGDAYAAKIIAGRPYAKKDQLKSRNILPAPVYEKTKDLIIAKQAVKEAVKPPAAKK
jgi:DNA uptake protein ComE-like DNA-binding protein